MPDLSFQVEGVEVASQGLTPMLAFALRVRNADPAERIQGAMIHAQVQIQPARRRYAAHEKERLGEVFGTPDRWGQTLRNRLWTHVDSTLKPFSGETEASLWIPCSFDLNIAATKYFDALDDGDASLLFLFSGTVFYLAADGRLQMERISWEKECTFVMPIQKWKSMMEEHYPNCAWLYLRRDVFDRLYAYKRAQGLTGWDETVDRLLLASLEEAAVNP
jgi:hypothetical protein